MLMIAAFLACSPPPPCAAGVGRVSVTNPNPAAPLASRLEVAEGDPVAVEVEWSTDGHGASLERAEASAHEHTLVGWRPGRTYEVETRLSGGSHTVERCLVDTPALPATFPEARVLVAEEGRFEPGDTLVTARPATINVPPALGVHVELVILYDPNGEVLWFLSLPALAQVAYEVADGLLVTFGMGPSARVAHVGWDGNERARWVVDGTGGTVVAAGRGGNFHHDAVPDPEAEGRFIGLVRSAERVEDWPRSHQEPEVLGPADVSFETVVTFETDGTVVDEVDLADLVPLGRWGCDSLSSVAPEGWADWAHANALVVDGDQMVVSLRNQDAVVAYGRDRADLRWILGNPANWPAQQEAVRLRPVDPDMSWFWHAHAPSFGPDLPDGRRQLLLFDNGNYGSAPPPHSACRESARAGRSRVVAYWVDESALTVEEGFVLDTVGGNPAFSPAVGDADWLRGGTVLSTWGMLPATAPDRGAAVGRVVEHDPVDGSEVWHLELSSSADVNPLGWNVIRADRLAPVAGRVRD